MLKKILFLSAVVAIFSTSACKEDDDATTGGTDNISVSLSPVSKFEGNSSTTFDFKVRLSGISTTSTTVDFQTNDRSAVAGEDYEAKNGTITFAAASDEEIISIVILTDTINEGDEEFEVTLLNPTNATISTETAIGTIRNDDTFVAGSDDGYTTPESYSGMTLVWQDEFSGTEIDPECWTHEEGNSGWGNNELQNYTDRAANSYLSNGKLVLEAKEENLGGSAYTSARMITKGKKEFVFGRVDIRAKLPKGQGIWPALWMLGDDIDVVGWPACGEIDVMELVGHEPAKVHGTAHWGVQGSGSSTFQGNPYSLPSGEFGDEFHVFSIIWENNEIRWLVDDNQFFSLTASQVGSLYPFNHEFFFIFNIAVGGNWPGNPDATTVFPQRMLVDYIRVFQ